MTLLLTKKEAAEFLGKSEVTIAYYAKTGRIRAVRDHAGRHKAILYRADDVAALAGRELPAEFLDTRRGTGVIITESVREARDRLLEALITACRESGLDEDEVQGKLSYFYSGLWNETEMALGRKAATVEGR